MLGVNIAFPGNSSYCRVVQKLDGCEVGGVDLVEGNRVLLESPFGILGSCRLRQLRGGLRNKAEISNAFSEKLQSEVPKLSGPDK